MAEAQLAGILRSVSGSIGNFNFRTTGFVRQTASQASG